MTRLRQRGSPWWRPPRTLKTTRIGRTYLVITLGVGLGALNTGNNMLYLVLGFGLAIIVLSGVLSERVLRGLSVKRVLPQGAFAGEPFSIRYRVSQAKGRAFAVKVCEAPGTLEGSAWVSFVEQGKPQVVRSQVTAPRRGPLRLPELKLSTEFPFGLFEKTRSIDLEDVLVVWPRRGFICEIPNAAQGLHVGDAGDPRQRDGSGDLLGLRELSDGEDARRVHWKKSASSTRLLKVEREREERRQYMLRIEAHASGEALERACEETAALTHRLLGEGSDVGLSAHACRIRPASGPGQERRVLTALAWLGFESSPPGDRK